jgi:ATP-dependent DNA helicase RecG
VTVNQSLTQHRKEFMPDYPLEETETLEFKRTWHKGVLETIAALANTQGGRVLIGVEDDGTITGFTANDQDLQKIVNEIVTVLSLHPSINWIDLEGQRVLEIRVPSATHLIACQGRYLARVGNTNRDMTPNQVAQRALELSGDTWDNLPLGSDADLDDEAIRRFARQAQARLPSLRESDPPERILENLNLRRNGQPTRAALMLFAKQPKRFFSNAQVHLGRFGDPPTGSNGAPAILDDRMIEGNLFDQLEAIFQGLRLYQQVGLGANGRITSHASVTQQPAQNPARSESAPSYFESLQRIERWTYPLDALREAVINALMHRDYTDPSEIQIRVHDDHLEIRNPGRLPDDLSTEDLRREGHLSRPRNPRIAQALYCAGLVERWGSGTTRMIEQCREAGLPEVEFIEEKRSFRVIFRQDSLTQTKLEALGLNGRQVLAMLFLKHNPWLDNTVYQNLSKASKRTASRDLLDLLERGLIERVGEGRAVTYRLERNGPKRGQTGQKGAK